MHVPRVNICAACICMYSALEMLHSTCVVTPSTTVSDMYADSRLHSTAL
jgi:hypothetical protein